MTEQQWKAFCAFRDDFRAHCDGWAKDYSAILSPLAKEASAKDTPAYDIENPIVYNTALDSVSQASDIRAIVIGDNPGKDEQRSANRKYLIGQSGKVAESFFRNHRAFDFDFRANAVILNKTPVHSAKTTHLKHIASASQEAAELIRETQLYMAQATAALHIALCEGGEKVALWLVGYSELRGRGIFRAYRDCLKAAYDAHRGEWENVFVFQHFSMNRFAIDFKAHYRDGENAIGALKALGAQHKQEIFQ